MSSEGGPEQNFRLGANRFPGQPEGARTNSALKHGENFRYRSHIGYHGVAVGGNAPILGDQENAPVELNICSATTEPLPFLLAAAPARARGST
jgi:hypothetical protein